MHRLLNRLPSDKSQCKIRFVTFDACFARARSDGCGTTTL